MVRTKEAKEAVTSFGKEVAKGTATTGEVTDYFHQHLVQMMSHWKSPGLLHQES